VVGAGPVGLTLAIDLRLRGVEVTLVDEDDTVSTGSRAICWAKRSLEIFDRLGVARPIVERGITWNKGRVFHRDREVYDFDLLPEAAHAFPAFVNLQQYHVEEALAGRAESIGVELLWKHRVTGLDLRDQPTLTVETPDGTRIIEAEWILACDGARSQIRRLMSLPFSGQVFEDRFLIADVHMQADFPTERWFWFDPPFHPGGSALLHRQADDIWRIDLQLGPDTDPVEERKPERVIPRLQAMLGADKRFELDWVSVYTFQCRRLDRFRHGRVFFLGDAAHQVSPFGARGANSGIQDTDNLAWKLAAVLEGRAGEALLDSYSEERVVAADENILNSTRSTDFITPKSVASLQLRTAVLQLAEHAPFARKLVNSGRLSVPCHLGSSSLNTRDTEPFDCTLAPGAPMDDAPLQTGSDAAAWLLDVLVARFHLLVFARSALDVEPAALRELAEAMAVHVVTPAPLSNVDLPQLVDHRGVLARRCDARPGTVYLLRPDQHVAARWRRLEPAAVRAALERALAGAIQPAELAA
jgi:3-(3-hydroxy-phenyl)propionate hydroxylase